MTAISSAPPPQIQFKPLNRADGSADFRDQLCGILVSVNGPVEVQRRDELPEEAAIEVNIRPLAGVGGPRERWLEQVLASLLRSVLLVHLYPRTLVQVTLQFTKEPDVTFTKGRGDIGVLPSLINAAFAGLIDAGLPLRTTAVAALVAVSVNGDVHLHPGQKDLASSNSVHAMAYDKDGVLLLDESIGSFEMSIWEKVSEIAQQACHQAIATAGSDDTSMEVDSSQHRSWLREALAQKVEQAGAWRETT